MGRRQPREVFQILHPERHTGERSRILAARDPVGERPCVSERLVRPQRDEGIDDRVQPLDAPDRGGHHVYRRQPSRPHFGRDLVGGSEREVHRPTVPEG